MSLKPISKIYQLLAAALAGLFLIIAIRELDASFIKPTAARDSAARRGEPNSFANLALEAQAAFILEPDTGKVLFAKNPDAPFPIASLTKVMMALAAERALSPESIIQFIGRPWRLSSLVDYTLVSSSNAAAAAIAAAAEHENGRSLVDEMNVVAKEIGLTTTLFSNPTGLDLADGNPSGVSSARDMAELFAYILKHQPELLAATRYPEFEVPALDGIRYRLTNTNKIVRDIPGLLASKTGYTDAAHGSLAVIFDRGLNQPVILIVLGSSETGRFDDVKKLISVILRDY